MYLIDKFLVIFIPRPFQKHFLKYFALLSLLILCATVTIHQVDAGVLHDKPCNSTSETQTST